MPLTPVPSRFFYCLLFRHSSIAGRISSLGIAPVFCESRPGALNWSGRRWMFSPDHGVYVYTFFFRLSQWISPNRE